MPLKKNFYHLYWVLLPCCLVLTSPNKTVLAQNKHALLIGVGDYPTKSGWQDLSAANDIELLTNALLLQGFPKKNIWTLKDDQASKAAIIQQLSEVFYNQLKDGDIALIHFSGHGQQIADDNGDEIDGYDEAIVPFDSPQQYQAGVYEGENLIRDEALGQLLVGIRKKLGANGHLLVTLDACHSGTGTRGLGVTRGTNKKMAASDYVIQNAATIKENNTLEKEIGASTKDLAPIVTFFSTSAGELSYEYKDEQDKSYGLLSYTFAKLLNTTKANNYQELLAQLKLEMNKLGALQTPQAEGTLTQQLFSGQLIKMPTSYKIKEIIDDKTIWLSAGQLQGITKDAVIAFYPKNTIDLTQTEPIATGMVTYASQIDADVKLNQPIAKAQLAACKAILKTSGFAPLQLKLQIDLPEGEAKQMLQEKITTLSTIQLVDNFPDLQLITKQENLQLINKQEQLIFQKELSTVSTIEVIQQIDNYARIAYLRRLEVKDKYLDLALQLINKHTGLPTDKYEIGETMQLQIINQGKKATYYQLVDIQPNNQYAIVIPTAPYVAADFLIQPGETQLVPIELEIYPPKGNELFKIIATNQPLDLQQSIFAQHQTKSNEQNPFDNLLNRTKGKINLKGEKARISILSKSFSIN